MNFELKSTFRIESARFLPQLPSTHPCSRVHGHSFELIFKFVGSKDPDFGWVIDYNDINKIIQPILNILDHNTLNDVEGLANPTSENLAEWLYLKVIKLIPKLRQVSVRETPNSECSYPA